ncbi:MAG: hypothetical protein LPD71_14570 [Shewanella sp.]|nr:hypothetical protein [Shewanella sp.]MCF1430336.1 hypothetical protein [Shewanella sp.]MCF1439912.1 hypothetical protein [Shewanella sp.]MCF1459311.1 hypothetical protein [Shewanella sp.]
MNRWHRVRSRLAGGVLNPKVGGNPIELQAQAAKLIEQALASGVMIKVA